MAIALAIAAAFRLVDAAHALPLAGLLLTIAALTWFATSGRFDDPPVVTEPPVFGAPSLAEERVPTSDVVAPPPTAQPVDDAPPVSAPVGAASVQPVAVPPVVVVPPVVREPGGGGSAADGPATTEPTGEPTDPGRSVADGRSGDEGAPAAATPRTVEHTFRLPAAVAAERVCLVGDFNGWSHTADPMQREGDWFTRTVELDRGVTYRYRYLLDGWRWENDWSADAYLPNEHGSDDSVVLA